MDRISHHGKPVQFGDRVDISGNGCIGMKLSLRRSDDDGDPGNERETDPFGYVQEMSTRALRERVRELEFRVQDGNPNIPRADPATGLGNSGYLWLQARKLAAAFERNGQPFTLVVIDAGGTGVPMKRLRRALLEVSRAEDTVGLLGGQYVGVLLTNASETAAQRFTERVRNALSWRPGEPIVEVTPVFGIAAWGRSFEGSLEALLSAAEKDLNRYRTAFKVEASGWDGERLDAASA